MTTSESTSTQQDFTSYAATTRAGHQHRQRTPSRAALAARSLAAVDRLPSGSAERASEFAAHLDQFRPGYLGNRLTACPVRPR